MAYEKWTLVDGNLVGFEVHEIEAAAGIFGILGRMAYFETDEDRKIGRLTNFQYYISADGARVLAGILLEKADESDSAVQNPPART